MVHLLGFTLPPFYDQGNFLAFIKLSELLCAFLPMWATVDHICVGAVERSKGDNHLHISHLVLLAAVPYISCIKHSTLHRIAYSKAHHTVHLVVPFITELYLDSMQIYHWYMLRNWTSQIYTKNIQDVCIAHDWNINNWQPTAGIHNHLDQEAWKHFITTTTSTVRV